MITEQHRAKKKLQKIKDNFKDARSAVKEGDLEKAVNRLFDGVSIAKLMADEVNFFESCTSEPSGVHYKLAGYLSHPRISKSVEPVFSIADKLKHSDNDNKYSAFTDFIIGVAYFAQRKYEFAVKYLKSAERMFKDPEDKYSSLLTLRQVYEQWRFEKSARKCLKEI